MKEIVLGYDGSNDARRALAAAADLVHKGATLTVVSAVHVPALVGYPREKTQSADHPQARNALEERESSSEGSVSRPTSSRPQASRSRRSSGRRWSARPT